ncbi:MAG TPA: SDR family oxidoreductase [Bacteroidota bacterium]
MVKALLTGGTGFLGSNLAEALLQRGYHVRILRRASSDTQLINHLTIEHSIGNTRDIESLGKAMVGIDLVFHTAAMVTFLKQHRDEQLEVNVGGTKNVVQACLVSGVRRLIHTSSIAAIGYPEHGELADEQTPYNWEGTGGYKYSKHAAEQEVYAGIKRGLDAVIVNPSVIIGERDIHFHGGHLLRAVKKGMTPLCVKGGMNIVYVGDVVNGEILAAERGKKGERYVLAGENLTHKDIFRRTARIVGGIPAVAPLPIPVLRFAAFCLEGVAKVTGTEPLVSRDLVAGAGKFNWFSSEKAIRELGYSVTPFDTTIRRAYQWYGERGML